MIYWHLFIISVMSISRLVGLFMIVLYLLKPASIIHYWAHVSLTFNYSATVYVLHIYRCIFFIWIHYFEFFTYFCLTWCSIFCCSRCWVIIYHILDLRCSLFTHCNIAYDIVLQIQFCVFWWHRMYISDMYGYIYIYVSMWTWYFYKSLQDIFLICYTSHTWYFYTNALYIKF